MRVFKTKEFARFARKAKLDDGALCQAIARAGRGLIDADLGGGLIKQRVARRREGRSGGFRTIIAVRMRDRAVFLHGFAKSEKDNIDGVELADLKDAATVILGLGNRALAKAIDDKELQEVFCDAKEISE